MTPADLDALREQTYERLCKLPSDINEHLPTLRRLAEKCEHVTEMGMRGGISTCALLAAQPKTLVSWDINPRSVLASEAAKELWLMAGKTSFQPRVGNTLEIFIEPTDMLFIDTLHTAKQLQGELRRHVLWYKFESLQRVRKYLVFHDTSTFGFEGEDGGPGLRSAIDWFQKNAFPLWHVVEDHLNNNGLLVMERFPHAT